jgi:hypothetical protein
LSLRCFAASVLLLLATPASLLAWEADLHYGLTKWLAVTVGFTDDAAETLARGNLFADQYLYDATRLVPWYACFGRHDVAASDLVRTLHFPSSLGVPNPSNRRNVLAGGPRARAAADKESSRKIPASYSQEQANSLQELGKALHALQDSWAHQGIPDRPFFCSDDYAWGHPKTRGGWRQHHADHTFRFPQDAIDAANATCTYLSAYLRNNLWASAGRGEPCSRIADRVQTFANLKTKTEKAAWFESQRFADVSFIADVTLPNGQRQFAEELRKRMASYGPPAIASPSFPRIPPDVTSFVTNVFNEWMGFTEPGTFLAKYVDTQGFLKNSALANFGPPDQVVGTAFFLWRVADHGLVSELGHPDEQGDGDRARFATLAKASADPSLILRYDGGLRAMIPLGTERAPFQILESGKDQYAVVGKFRHAPSDTVVVIVERIQGRWRVSGLSSIVDH